MEPIHESVLQTFPLVASTNHATFFRLCYSYSCHFFGLWCHFLFLTWLLGSRAYQYLGFLLHGLKNCPRSLLMSLQFPLSRSATGSIAFSIPVLVASGVPPRAACAVQKMRGYRVILSIYLFLCNSFYLRFFLSISIWGPGASCSIARRPPAWCSQYGSSITSLSRGESSLVDLSNPKTCSKSVRSVSKGSPSLVVEIGEKVLGLEDSWRCKNFLTLECWSWCGLV